MNAGLMRDYVEYVADFLLVALGYTPLFMKANPVSESKPIPHVPH